MPVHDFSASSCEFDLIQCFLDKSFGPEHSVATLNVPAVNLVISFPSYTHLTEHIIECFLLDLEEVMA